MKKRIVLKFLLFSVITFITACGKPPSPSNESLAPSPTSEPTVTPTSIVDVECPGLISESIQEMVRSYVDQGLNVGIVVGIVTPCGREYYAYGQTALSGGQPVNENTVFEIGSTGKAFTTLLLADMVERGEVKLDEPIERFLTEEDIVPTYRGQSIRLIDLATHTSGLPIIPDNIEPAEENNPYADYTVEQMYSALQQIQLTHDIGVEYEYSNFGMGLLGHVLSLETGQSYEEMIITQITDILGMSHTRSTLSPEMQEQLATGYRDGEAMPLWKNPTLAGAGDLRSTVHDMLIFLAANLGLEPSPLYEAMQLTHEPHFLVDATMDVGLGWHIRNDNSMQIIEHHGATGGYWSYAGFSNDNLTGVVVLTNTFHDVDSIGLELLQSVPDLP